MAGDVIFTEGGEAAATAVRQIETARQAQHQEADAETAVVAKQQTLTAGAVAGFVGAGGAPAGSGAAPRAVDRRRRAACRCAPAHPWNERRRWPHRLPAPAPSPARLARLTSQVQGSLFKAATDVVTDLGRVRDVPELTRVLGRAADVMDASGLIVWIGSAGGVDLRPVLAHGYSEEAIARFPPVPRSGDNAAAAAYRSGTLQIVNSRPGGARGAVVAPILSVDGCIGALSVEIRSGGKHRRASRRWLRSSPRNSPGSSRRRLQPRCKSVARPRTPEGHPEDVTSLSAQAGPGGEQPARVLGETHPPSS